MSRVRRPRTEAPDDLSPEEWTRLAQWVAEREPWAQGELVELLEACLDHHRAYGNVMADWVACARTWIRNERNFRRRRGGAVNGSAANAPRGGLAGAAFRVGEDFGFFGPRGKPH